MWICWISGVESEGARKHRSQRGDISPPVLPVRLVILSLSRTVKNSSHRRNIIREQYVFHSMASDFRR
jgi:hypothetical protein